MATYGVAEAKNNFAHLLDLVQKGEKVTITRHGKPIAELRHLSPQTLEERARIHAAYAARRDSRPPLPVSSVLLLDDMYEERR